MNFYEYITKVKGYSKSTGEVYARYVKDLLDCNNEDYIELLNKKNINNNTKRVLLSACKTYYLYKSDARSKEIILPKSEYKVKDFFSFEEYSLFIKTINLNCKTKFMKYIIVRILFETGIRSSELLQIRKEDIVDNKIKINGKGSKQRNVYISKWLKTDIEKYIIDCKQEKLFSFTYKNLYKKILSISHRKITPHMLRRGFANYCISKNISIYDLSIMMGHNDINTTASYVNKSDISMEMTSLFS